jgi:hypothetical protein
MSWFVCNGFVSPFGELLLALPKSNQKASPEPRFILRCSQRAGTAQLVSAASLNLLRKLACTEASPLRGYVFARGSAGMRAVGSWCDAWIARCSAPRRGLTARFVAQQLFASNDCPAVVSACFSRLLTLSILRLKRPLSGRSTRKAIRYLDVTKRATTDD